MSRLDKMIRVTELKETMNKIWNLSIDVDMLLEMIKDTDLDDSKKDILIEKIYNKHQETMDILFELLYDEDK